KVGMEAQESGFVPGAYQLSQRADFMEAELGVDTMHNRPILNTRDEPHADRTKYRRLHLILGDANMCEYATALKVGTTRLVLDLLQRGVMPNLELDQPVAAIKQLSRDPELKTTVRLKDGRTMSGLAIQEAYWNAASRSCSGADPDAEWVLREWQDTLRLLSQDRAQLVGKLDWVTKQWLLETFVREERLAWDDPWLTSLDLEYHNMSPDRGLFLGLEAEGKTWRMTTERDITQALSAGPSDTRGGLRGLCVRRFPEQITTMQWERIQFSGGLRARTLEMGDLFHPDDVQACAALFETAASPADALAAWSRRKETS
ncbi:MAG: proteasome accessory factor PafA2 family protein, partial [Nitrospira sp.]